MKLLYIASPYTSRSKKVEKSREEEVTKVAAGLTLRYGHAMFLPITQSAAMKRYSPRLGTTFEAWKDIDLYAISKCDEVWVILLDGWNKSTGVNAEIAYAKENNIPVYYICPSTLDFIFGQSLEDLYS